MCVIIDIPVVHKVFRTHDADFKPLHSHLMDGRARMVYGGKVRREYLRIEWFRRLLVRLDQQGSALQIPDALVDAAAKAIRSTRICKSNDHHVIALAQIAKVRILCTDDIKLICDFKNKNLLDEPRGKIYRYASHVNLLREHCLEAHGKGRVALTRPIY